MRRNLSGIYFRHKTDKGFENVCFEELPEKEQRARLKKGSKNFAVNMAVMLGRVLVKIGNELGLVGR